MKIRELFKKASSDSEGMQNRRSFLQQLGLGGVLVSLGGFTFQSFRSLVPNVLYEAPVRFKVGLPAQMADGVTYLEDKRLFVFKEGQTFHAISAACTHLGCTVKYTKLNQPKQVDLKGEQKAINFEFQCPCHGSKYDADGTNYAGPAPSPLRCYKLEVSPDDGQLVADLGTEVDQNFRLTV